MSGFVVDTNVAVTANGKVPQAGPACTLACVEALRSIVQGSFVVLDTGYEILDEYARNLGGAGQPGPGDAFLKWLWQNQANTERCRRVPITALPGSAECYAEFPPDPRLRGFHNDDRKFVAVARASNDAPRILNAVDSDWWLLEHILSEHGVELQHLCPEQVSNWQRRHGARA